MNNNSNGRVNIIEPSIDTKFSMMDKIPVENKNFLNSLTGNFERSLLSDNYFSKSNIKIIQNGIRKGVFDKSNGKILIDDQNVENIVTVMRSVYLQYSKNQDFNIAQQISDLNNYVLEFCVNNVFSEAVAYLNYKKDASTMHNPIVGPIYSNKTNKTLELKPFF